MGKVKTAGSFRGKSNRLGYGGRAAQLKAQGVPGGVIGNLARAAGAAPGGPNYHGGSGGHADTRTAAIDRIAAKRQRAMKRSPNGY